MAQFNTQFSKNTNIAVLIDGDNAQPKLLEKILLEVARHGTITHRRIYGDWTTPNMTSWKPWLHEHAITPVQQFRNTVGKNATDSTLIIEAMDILYTRAIRAFCIVSSDSDYTRLATRIREEGITFIGIGKKQTPLAFVKACDIFIYTENLEVEPSPTSAEIIAPPAAAKVAAPQPKAKKATSAKAATPKATKPAVPAQSPPTAPGNGPGKKPPPIDILRQAFAMSVEENGWASLSLMGTKLRQIDPAFDSRTWGYSQLSLLIKAIPVHFAFKKSAGAGGAYVQEKPLKGSK